MWNILKSSQWTPWTFGLVRNFRTCVQSWYLPLYWGIFPRKTKLWKWVISPIFSDFLCVHNTKCLGIFLRLATVAASVIMDFKIFNMCRPIGSNSRVGGGDKPYSPQIFLKQKEEVRKRHIERFFSKSRIPVSWGEGREMSYFICFFTTSFHKNTCSPFHV
jgi:hypothetical protein